MRFSQLCDITLFGRWRPVRLVENAVITLFYGEEAVGPGAEWDRSKTPPAKVDGTSSKQALA